MEPDRKTEENLLAIQAELAALEPIFHHPELGTTRSVYESMTEQSFWEVGASGRRYSREYVIQTLIERYSGPYSDFWRTEEFYCQEIARELYLLSYTLHQGERVTRRATIWRRAVTGWKIVFHQGTIVELNK